MLSNPCAPVRILHVVESWGAGVATAVLAYIRHAPEFEHHLLHGERAETAALPADWAASFASVTPLPSAQWRRIGTVGALARELEVNIVHAHSSFAGLYTRLGMLSTKRRRIIYTPHAYGFERQDLSPVLRAALRSVEWLLANNTDTIAACSPREKRLSRFKYAGVKTILLPNVIDAKALDTTATKHFPATTDPLRVAGSGRIGTQKDPDYFIASIKTLQDAGHHVSGTWIGGGEPLAEQRLIAAGITVTGWLDRYRASGILAQQDLYLHTAAWEGFPMAVLEADALGVATVVRERPHFAGLGLPLVITESTEIAEQWERFSTPESRQQLVEATRGALAGNTPAAQTTALRALYGTGHHAQGRALAGQEGANHA